MNYVMTHIIHRWTDDEKERMKKKLLKAISKELGAKPEELTIEGFSMPNVRVKIIVSGPFEARKVEKNG